MPPPRQHSVEPRRNRRHLQLQLPAVADARLRQLGRQFRVRERRRQTSFEHQDRGNEKRKHVVVPCAREGVPEEGMPLGRAPRARRGAWQEEGVHRHRLVPLRERIHQGDRALARKPGHHVHDVLERRARPHARLRQGGREADGRVQAGRHHRRRRRLRDGRREDHVGPLRAPRGRLPGHGDALHGYPQARLQVPEDGREGVLRVRPDLGRNGL